MLSLKNHKTETIRHFWLYAIALEQSKYYVGITAQKDPYTRLRQHGGLLGARWTKRYKPIKPIVPLVLEELGVISLASAEAREQSVFEEFVARYGLRNVRGGRVTSTGRVYKLGRFYFNQEMLETLGVALLLLACSLYILLAG